ncbi:unnamed protein product, partial [Arabidopsis halleri]
MKKQPPAKVPQNPKYRPVLAGKQRHQLETRRVMVRLQHLTKAQRPSKSEILHQ